MKIIQVAHALTQNDAASQQLLNMDRIFRELGYESKAYAHKLDARLKNEAETMDAFEASDDDIIIYHMTTGTSFNKWVYKYPRKIVLFYHNITPAKYFFGNAWGSWLKCLKGRRDLKKIVKNTFFAWGASEYSQRELEELGLKHTKVLPIVVNPDDYKKYDKVQAIVDTYGDGYKNIIVVGRGVPHKRQDEAIEAAAWYRDHISDKIRLVIIGGIKESFAKKLHALVKKLNMEKHVLFTGKISNEELCTWYGLCDAVLSLSEHEGFCVPLIEGMIFDKPVIAYAGGAVPETLGKAGVLLREKKPELVANTINETLTNELLLETLRKERQQRLKELSYEALVKRLKEDIEEIRTLQKEVLR